MDVFLIPVGIDRYELYCEMPDDDPTPHAAGTQRSFFKNLIHRFREAVAEAERERHAGSAYAHRPPSSFYQRIKRRFLCRVAETIAEQRLLWHLRRQTIAKLIHPDDLSGSAATEQLRASLRADFEKHRRWLIIDGVLLILSGALILVPGPNVIGYYLAFRVVGHYLSYRGATQGLQVVDWNVCPSAVLTELRPAIAMEPEQRAARVSDVAARLRLERLAHFFQRTVVPSA
jgi:hypothetical protein